jgi:glycine cleavage system aminomethyltransferase T
VGLGFAVNLNKEGDFIGKQASIKKKAEAPYAKRLVQVLVRDPQPMMFHAEIVRRNGVAVGDVRAASYGHTLGGAVGLAMVEGEVVNQAYLDDGQWEVEIAGKTYPAMVSFRPLYDPTMERVRA